MVINISVEAALKKLTDDALTKAMAAYKQAPDHSSQRLTTTVRLEEPVKEFYSVLAVEMGVSMQALLAMMLKAMIQGQQGQE